MLGTGLHSQLPRLLPFFFTYPPLLMSIFLTLLITEYCNCFQQDAIITPSRRKWKLSIASFWLVVVYSSIDIVLSINYLSETLSSF